MDILQELPYDQWPEVQEKLRKLWPYNLPGYYALHLNTKHPGVRNAFQFKVYCPYGQIDNGIVALSIKSLKSVVLELSPYYEQFGPRTFDKDLILIYYEDERLIFINHCWNCLIKDCRECILFSISKDTSKLMEALLNTKLIDWSKAVLFDSVSSVTMKYLEKLKSMMEFKHCHIGLTNMYVLDYRSEPYKDLRCPPNTYMSAVKPQDLQRVDDTWPYQHPKSYFYFSTLASNGLSYSLYSSVTNELLAWMFLNEKNCFCHLYCEEEHRQKGYSEFLVQYVGNSLLSQKCDAYAYVVEGNEIPTKLFSKLGFKVVDRSGYLYAQK